jgi:hypothetical protein
MGRRELPSVQDERGDGDVVMQRKIYCLGSERIRAEASGRHKWRMWPTIAGCGGLVVERPATVDPELWLERVLAWAWALSRDIASGHAGATRHGGLGRGQELQLRSASVNTVETARCDSVGSEFQVRWRWREEKSAGRPIQTGPSPVPASKAPPIPN